MHFCVPARDAAREGAADADPLLLSRTKSWPLVHHHARRAALGLGPSRLLDLDQRAGKSKRVNSAGFVVRADSDCRRSGRRALVWSLSRAASDACRLWQMCDIATDCLPEISRSGNSRERPELGSILVPGKVMKTAPASGPRGITADNVGRRACRDRVLLCLMSPTPRGDIH